MPTTSKLSLHDIELVIRRQVLQGTCSLESIAHALESSPRSLQRHLSKHGSSFTDLLTEARRSIACALLAETEVPVCAVGRKIGYSDAANFGRAFRHWTGQTPRSWRESTRKAPRPCGCVRHD